MYVPPLVGFMPVPPIMVGWQPPTSGVVVKKLPPMRLISRLKNMSRRQCLLFACSAIRRVADDGPMPKTPYEYLCTLQSELRRDAVVPVASCPTFPWITPPYQDSAELQELVIQVARHAVCSACSLKASRPVEGIARALRLVQCRIQARKECPNWRNATLNADRFHLSRDKHAKEELARQFVIVNDIARPLKYSPFSYQQGETPPPTLEQVLAWNGGTVRSMATCIDNDGSYDQLPVLADALEEAGVRDETLLEHLRGDWPHFPGCWALDVLLSRR